MFTVVEVRYGASGLSVALHGVFLEKARALAERNHLTKKAIDRGARLRKGYQPTEESWQELREPSACPGCTGAISLWKVAETDETILLQSIATIQSLQAELNVPITEGWDLYQSEVVDGL